MHDIAVVGGGVLGMAVTSRFASEGKRVIQLSSTTIAGAATPASGAMLGVLGELTPEETAEDLELRVRAARTYDEWAGAGRVPVPALGTFLVGGDQHQTDLESLGLVELAAERLGQRCERVEPEDVPGLRPTRGRRAARVLYLEREGRVDPSAMLQMLEDSVAGIDVRDEVALRIAVTGERAVGVHTSTGRIEANEVVLCAGPRVRDLLAASGIDEQLVYPMVFAKGVAVVLDAPLDPPTPYVLRTPNRDFACGLHLVPQHDGALYVGATNRASREASTLGRSTAGEIAFLITEAGSELDHRLAARDVRDVRWGLRALPADGRPVVGRTAMPGLSVCSGAYRNGVLLAPLLADVLAAEINGGGAEPRLSPCRPRGTFDASVVLAAGMTDLTSLLRRADWEPRMVPTLEALARLAVRPQDEELSFLDDFRGLLSTYGRAEMIPEAIIELLQATEDV